MTSRVGRFIRHPLAVPFEPVSERVIMGVGKNLVDKHTYRVGRHEFSVTQPVDSALAKVYRRRFRFVDRVFVTEGKTSVQLESIIVRSAKTSVEVADTVQVQVAQARQRDSYLSLPYVSYEALAENSGTVLLRKGAFRARAEKGGLILGNGDIHSATILEGGQGTFSGHLNYLFAYGTKDASAVVRGDAVVDKARLEGYVDVSVQTFTNPPEYEGIDSSGIHVTTHPRTRLRRLQPAFR